MLFSNQATIGATSYCQAMFIHPQTIGSTTSTTSFVQGSSSVEYNLPTNRSRQAYEVFLFRSSGLFTCSNMPFLAGLKKQQKNRNVHTQIYVERWDNLYTT